MARASISSLARVAVPWAQTKSIPAGGLPDDASAARIEAAGATVATGLEVVVHPGAGVQLVSAAGYPLESNGTGSSFRIGSLQAGQERKLWLTYRVDPKSAGSNASLGELGTRFQADGVELAALQRADAAPSLLNTVEAR